MANLNNQSIVVVLECIKNSAKTNLTYTTPENSTTRFVNITGKAVEVRGLTVQGTDVSEYVLGARITVCCDPISGFVLIEETQELFDERAAVGEKSPVVNIRFELGKLDQTSTGYIGKYVSNIEIIDTVDTVEQAISLDMFKKNANAIVVETRQASDEAINRASLLKKKVKETNQTQNAAVAGHSSLRSKSDSEAAQEMINELEDSKSNLVVRRVKTTLY